MGNYKEIKGDLIELTYQKDFDVIGHGCNCMCVQGAGLAVDMVKHFRTNTFILENYKYRGKREKLGKIDYESFIFNNEYNIYEKTVDETVDLYVVNCYTQYYYGTKFGIPVVYDAIRSCMKEINNKFKGKRIGLPLIGAGLAGGDWNIIKEIIQEELIDCDVTIVHYKK